MTDEMIWKEAVVIIEVLPRNLPGVTEENYEKYSNRAPPECTGLECCLWITLLGAHTVNLNINYFTEN
jgi:hypothetical protein